MYSDKKNILQLAALLEAHHVTKVVLCPGSRNAPIVHTLSTHPAFTCYSVTDERSAGYFAIGMALQEKTPVAVCCTSGTALLNLHPAVAEAFYQQVPLIVISGDRPAAWVGQMDGQTIPQPNIFHNLIRKSVNLPEIQNETDEWYCNRLINEALLEACHRVNGPVHINITLSEPLFNFTVEQLPTVRVINRYQKADLSTPTGLALINKIKSYGKRMIIMGQARPEEYVHTEKEALLQKQYVCLSEHIGNRPSHETSLRNFDVALYTMSEDCATQMAPDLLITCGGHIVSKRLKQFIRQHPPKEHWHVSPNGEVVDLFGALTTVLEMDPADFMNELTASNNDQPSEYCHLWEDFCKAIPDPSFSYSAMSAVGMLIKKLPQASVLHLANSSSIRYAQLYPLSPSVEVFCNRGVNGIDGSLSTAVGYAAGSDKLNFMIIGDLSFFYDMNALWNAHISRNLRILLINNEGGEIFHTLPGLKPTDISHNYITAAHRTSAKGWAEERGFIYLQAKDEGQLHQAMEGFTQPEQTGHPLLLEVFTSKDTDTALLKEYYHLQREAARKKL